jgi:hypothetical protein
MTTEQLDLPSLVLDSPDPVELEGLRRDLRFVSEGIATILENLPVQRRPLSDATRELHIRVTWLRRNGFCPCCQREWVCREGEKLPGAEFDHFFARHRNGPEESWLVCGSCNARLENVHFKTHVRATFDAYQQALRVFLGAEQRELFQ